MNTLVQEALKTVREGDIFNIYSDTLCGKKKFKKCTLYLWAKEIYSSGWEV